MDSQLAGNYYLSTVLHASFDVAKQRVTGALQNQGFSVLTEIDLQAKFKEKVDKDIPRYLVLGACGAGFAYRAWEVDPRIGTLLPCNAVLRELEEGGVEVLIRDPLSMVPFSPGIAAIADEVATKLRGVIAELNG